ncbi:class I SAM-dependent methyltransferase [Methermicoccus shengliensis]|uniref:Class I SAM-dependent methyltransferase n=1 Tax=Methermicoccus shengliensis TaxID=660064 RepID=A0A832RW35_9EURY|nr:methyltransferase domain-containing protein [Methermicoccus shengliensis]KUK05135.1 MAG: Methylase involved in ubiquinone/menaquinone biosynthesis [Euryarchaeota archaeon 55_53]KUK30701.1 MAG: Methylase involved in ubiquinone/menaquinone biosynthesis [Methanosarcinales archeaon 56_1174]MDI3487295.1 hypothetical protein [Methanosarcinales archaeon]MDN5294631.1 hypothetical protein [Methanosarcinales archaeon]HIH69338.1 class I SAM-dependent methyltransferase [Methermicoccus shengliensis]
MGGLKATKELIELCHVDKNSYVLDVGCGVGITACYMAKRYGCKVNRIWRDDRIVPFEDNIFDAVISESVNAFTGNKQKAIGEYKRVVK